MLLFTDKQASYQNDFFIILKGCWLRSDETMHVISEVQRLNFYRPITSYEFSFYLILLKGTDNTNVYCLYTRWSSRRH